MIKKLMILAGVFMMFQFGYSVCIRSYYRVVDGTFKYTGAGQNRVVKNVDIETFEVIHEYKPIPEFIKSPVPTCGPPNIEKFKDKNGTYELKDIQNGKLQLEE